MFARVARPSALVILLYGPGYTLTNEWSQIILVAVINLKNSAAAFAWDHWNDEIGGHYQRCVL